MSEFKQKKYKRISNTGLANYALLEHIEAIDMLHDMDFELICKIYE